MVDLVERLSNFLQLDIRVMGIVMGEAKTSHQVTAAKVNTSLLLFLRLSILLISTELKLIEHRVQHSDFLLFVQLGSNELILSLLLFSLVFCLLLPCAPTLIISVKTIYSNNVPVPELDNYVHLCSTD